MTKQEAGRRGGRPRLPTYEELRSQKLLTEYKTKEVITNQIKLLKTQIKKRVVLAN